MRNEDRRVGDSTLLVLALFACLLCATPAFAQTQPTTADALESRSVVRSRSTTAPAATGGNIDWQRIVIATFVVLGLIVALRYLAGWLMPGVRAGGGRGLRVLSRTPISPRQQVLLLHVGRRVVVVGDSAGTLSSLAMITEPDEVAELIGQAAMSPASARFGTMFGRAQQPFENDLHENMTAADDPDATPSADPAIAEAQDEIAGLRERMAKLAKTMGR